MKYRIITDGEGFLTQCRFRFWPFWQPVFSPGFNWYGKAEDAERAIARVIGFKRSDGRVVNTIEDSP